MAAEITSTIANHVLFHTGHGGYPAGSFTTALLRAWEQADYANAARLAQGWPAYAAALELVAERGGIGRLQSIASSTA
ncbi:hypothetical protein [Streptomyces sp. NPDC051684]|uniref:hypothetical protein n=1 Tax=Streptomyces sp. NPDC051684 TaxID=3365670 RepID=UPI0037B9549F